MHSFPEAVIFAFAALGRTATAIEPSCFQTTSQSYADTSQKLYKSEADIPISSLGGSSQIRHNNATKKVNTKI